MGFIFIPATMVAYLGVPQEKSNAVAGLVNFVRNIGAGVGTSAVTTVLAAARRCTRSCFRITPG